MHRIWIVSVAFILTSCGSSLTFIVDRFDLEDEEARAAYDQIYPPPTHDRVTRDLRRFEQNLIGYRNSIIAAGEVSNALIETPSGFDSTPINMAFAGLLAEIDREVIRVEGLAQAEPSRRTTSLSPLIDRLWYEIPGRLEGAVVIPSEAELDNFVRNNEPNQVQQVADSFRDIARRTPGLSALELPTDATQVIANLPRLVELQLLSSQQQTLEAWQHLLGRGGDLVERRHEVYQDLSDPFLAFVAANPDLWRRLPNSGHVSGDGDTEFILVFENTLDGRWKTVTVDPSTVIQARLAIGRRIVDTLASALGGIATSAFPVPLPPGVEIDDAEDGSIDFSRMTAHTELAELRNRDRTERLLDLRAYAARALAELAPQNVAETRREFLRRLAGVVQEE